jgi:hypothetical protein
MLLDFLRDNVWQFVIGFLGLVFGFIYYLLQRQQKRLSYEVLTNTLLVSVKEEVESRLQILFDGEVVHDVRIVVIRLTNTGNVPICTSDYEVPISLDFGSDSRLLTAQTIDTSPDNLEAPITMETTKAVFAPILLNSRDSITIKVLVSGFNNQLVVGGRIVGVRAITEKAVYPALATLLGSAGMIMLFASFVLVVVFEAATVGLIVCCVGVVLIALSSYLRRRWEIQLEEV